MFDSVQFELFGSLLLKGLNTLGHSRKLPVLGLFYRLRATLKYFGYDSQVKATLVLESGLEARRASWGLTWVLGLLLGSGLP